MSILENNGSLVDGLILEARKFYALKYQMSDGGNLSIRIPGTNNMIVKGTNTDFGSLDKSSVVVASFSGMLVEGNIKPSKECLLHGAIYNSFPEIGAIMHCHSPWATSWAARHDSLTFSTHHSKIKLGGYCPVIDTNSYVVPKEYFDIIINIMKKNAPMKSFLIRGHGQVSCGSNIHDAALTAELVEETAMIASLSER